MGQKFATAESAPSGREVAQGRAESGATRSAPPPPVTPHGRPQTRAGRSAAPHTARASRRSRRRAHGTGLRAPWLPLPTPRAAPTRLRHSRAAPAPLSRHPPPSAWPRRPPPGGCPESAVARGLEARRRGAGHNPPPPPPRLPCPSAGLLQAATGLGRPAALREPRESPPPPEPPGGNANGHGHGRDASARTAARGGGACTPLGGGALLSRPRPQTRPAARAPRAPAGSRPRAPAATATHPPPARPRASGARLRGRPWESEDRGGARGRSAEGGASAASPVRRPVSEGHGGAGESEAAGPVHILTEGRPSARRPCGEGEWPPRCCHCSLPALHRGLESVEPRFRLPCKNT